MNSGSEYLEKWNTDTPGSIPVQVITRTCPARVGLVGNPSYGFKGRTLSLVVSNFYATVHLTPTPGQSDIKFIGNPLLDPTCYSSLEAASQTVGMDGYSGALCLFLATARVLVAYTREKNLKIDCSRGFRIAYETCIPRQVGLAGSSALITAFLSTLLVHYNLESDICLDDRAEIALIAENKELGCASGLQDRVVQAYGGCMYMDFTGDVAEYTRIPLDPGLRNICRGMWLAYVLRPENSGKVHSEVRKRWLEGEEEVLQAMTNFANLALESKDAITRSGGDRKTFAGCMQRNFEQRRKLYGDEVIGKDNLKIVEIGNRNGYAVKFSGSGGCCIGLWKGDDDEQEKESESLEAVRLQIRQAGFVFTMALL